MLFMQQQAVDDYETSAGRETRSNVRTPAGRSLEEMLETIQRGAPAKQLR
jgi:hypothetical protein